MTKSTRSKGFPAAGADVVREPDGWGVRPAGSERAVSVHARQADALEAANKLAKAGGGGVRIRGRGRGAARTTATQGAPRSADDGSLTVGAFDAKTNLSGLLDRVEKGGVVVITRHDRPVAKLVPIHGGADDPVRRAIARLKSGDFGARLSRGSTLAAFLSEARR